MRIIDTAIPSACPCGRYMWPYDCRYFGAAPCWH